MITKELQQLSDKLTGGHINDHEISKQVDYIEKNYSGGGSGGGGSVFVDLWYHPSEGRFIDIEDSVLESLRGMTINEIASTVILHVHTAPERFFRLYSYSVSDDELQSLTFGPGDNSTAYRLWFKETYDEQQGSTYEPGTAERISISGD